MKVIQSERPKWKLSKVNVQSESYPKWTSEVNVIQSERPKWTLSKVNVQIDRPKWNVQSKRPKWSSKVNVPKLTSKVNIIQRECPKWTSKVNVQSEHPKWTSKDIQCGCLKLKSKVVTLFKLNTEIENKIKFYFHYTLCKDLICSSVPNKRPPRLFLKIFPLP